MILGVAFGELKMLNFRPFKCKFISIYDFLGLHASLPKKTLHFTNQNA